MDIIVHSKPSARVRRWAFSGAVASLLGLALIQAIPYGHDHLNPPVTQEPAWDSPTTRELAVRACYNCHSNQTVWPWYSNIAPISWLVQHDVTDGRRKLNFSQWDQSPRGGNASADEVQRGSMPPWFYLPLHPTAQLSAAEQQQLIDGLVATFGRGSVRQRPGKAESPSQAQSPGQSSEAGSG